MTQHIIIIGGGIAGLTSATLLIQNGFKVTLVEASDSLGGLAKSRRLDNGLTTEHSLRVYHKTYHCLSSILTQIPYDQHSTVLEQIVPIPFALLYDQHSVSYTSNTGNSIRSLFGKLKLAHFLYRLGFSWGDFWQLFKKEFFLRIFQESLTNEVSKLTIAEWMAPFSPRYREVIQSFHQCAFAATQNTSASLAIKFIIENNPFSYLAMTNGPTSERIFVPWEKYLVNLGVSIKKKCRVIDFSIQDNDISSIKLENQQQIKGDIFILAASNLSVMHLAQTSMLRTISNLSELNINTEWCCGIQFYLKDLPKSYHFSFNPFVPGVLQTFLHSPWKLNSVIQGEGFWENITLPKQCRYILSVTCIGGETPGTIYKKLFSECTKAEIFAELLQQCQFEQQELIIGWHIDDGLDIISDKDYQIQKSELPPHQAHKRNDGQWMINYAPLTVPTPSNLNNAPHARTNCKNLYLAGDFCKSKLSVPTMEKACETGFLATQAICNDLNSSISVHLPSYIMKKKLHWRRIFHFLIKPQKKKSAIRKIKS